MQELARLVAEHAADYLDARFAQARAAAAGVLSGVGDREDDACDARGDECLGAGAGATGVIAGFEGDDGGEPGGRAPVVRSVELRGLGAPLIERAGPRELRERIHLRVRRARAAVPALRHDLAGGGDEHAADLGVHAEGGAARGELERATHRGLVGCCFGHPVCPRLRGRRTPG